MQHDTNTRLVTPPGPPADIYSAIIQFHGNGLQQGASLGIADAMLASTPWPSSTGTSAMVSLGLHPPRMQPYAVQL